MKIEEENNSLINSHKKNGGLYNSYGESRGDKEQVKLTNDYRKVIRPGCKTQLKESHPLNNRYGSYKYSNFKYLGI